MQRNLAADSAHGATLFLVSVQPLARRLSENSILDDLAIVNSTTYEVKKAE
jgi:hypothetical protein